VLSVALGQRGVGDPDKFYLLQSVNSKLGTWCTYGIGDDLNSGPLSQSVKLDRRVNAASATILNQLGFGAEFSRAQGMNADRVKGGWGTMALKIALVLGVGFLLCRLLTTIDRPLCRRPTNGVLLYGCTYTPRHY
jgi:hypothetical protein